MLVSEPEKNALQTSSKIKMPNNEAVEKSFKVASLSELQSV